MLVTDVIRLATRMFRTNRSRTLLTILGISVGIGTILFLVSLGYGLQELILTRITTSEALLSLDVTSADPESIKLTDESIVGIQAIGTVDRISPLITAQSQIVINDITSELTANFAASDYFRLEGTKLKQGEFWNDADPDLRVLLMSESALALFNLGEEAAAGVPVHLSFYAAATDEKGTISRAATAIEEEFRIGGIVAEDGANAIYLPLPLAKTLDLTDYSKLKVKVKTEADLPLVRNALIDQGYVVSALSDIIEQANQVFQIVQIVLASFGIVALIVSAIGMFNTMTIALLERTQEIGIMKALGATSGDIWKLFLAEAVIIGFLGGLGGLSIGLLGGTIFNYGINLLAGAFGGERIDMFATPLWFAATIMTFSTVVGLITGFYPARRAAKISPLEAVRYK